MSEGQSSARPPTDDETPADAETQAPAPAQAPVGRPLLSLTLAAMMDEVHAHSGAVYLLPPDHPVLEMAVMAGLPRKLTGKSRIADLYAGVGTLSLPLATRASVAAFEVMAMRSPPWPPVPAGRARASPPPSGT